MKEATYKVKRIMWDGTKWEIRMLTDNRHFDRLINNEQFGSVESNFSILSFWHIGQGILPAESVDDCSITTQFHEVLHHAFPQYQDSKEEDEAKLNQAARILMGYLRAHGVDLSPLLKGYR